MVLTCDQAKAALKHILNNVIDFSDGEAIPRALDQDGRYAIHDLLSLSDTEIDALTWETTDLPPITKQLNGAERGILHAFQGFVIHRAQ